MATRSTTRSPWKASRAGSHLRILLPETGIEPQISIRVEQRFRNYTFYPRVEFQTGILSLSLLPPSFVFFPSFIPLFLSLSHLLPPLLFPLGKG